MRMRNVWFVIIALGLYAVALYWFHPASQGPALPPGSSSSATDSGSMAMMRLWHKLGLGFEPWEENPALLPSATPETLVSVEPQSSQYTNRPTESLLKWVRAGHRLIWVVSGNNTLLQNVHVHLAGTSTKHVSNLSEHQGETSMVIDGLSLTSTMKLEGSGLNKATQTWVMSSGRVVAATIPYGQGQIQIWSVPAAWENEQVGNADNFRLVWDSVGNQSLMWDEYGHGVSSGGLLATMFRGTRLGALWLLIVWFLLFVWRGLSRFGRPQMTEFDAPRLGTEFVEAMAWQLEQPALRSYARDLLVARVRKQMSQRLGFVESTSWSTLDRTMHAQDAKIQDAYRHWRQLATQDVKQTRKTWRVFLRATKRLLTLLKQDEPSEAGAHDIDEFVHQH